VPAANKRVPRVLLTDLQLPDGHGGELIGETRERFPDIEFMAISVAWRRGNGGEAEGERWKR
jgi:DNA-binding NarL/FixJ family response regulator